ncbi:hypothetical protein DID77_00730 [Candidatus Marinamargulisbacteria bacterium SCGC AG-439-L15]|nr:hypothetical protein DID77_00730 [Candidatus Marinamargulisbacteria bacterium SCGC AG-439-L15]
MIYKTIAHYSKDDCYLLRPKLRRTIQVGPLYLMLSLGEADLAFSKAYHDAYPYCHMISTTFESLETNQARYQKTISNLDSLSVESVQVLSSIDARTFSNSTEIKGAIESTGLSPQKIYFNFPYPPSGYTNNFKETTDFIHSLLKEFLLQCKQVLAPNGEVLVGGFKDRLDYYNPKIIAKALGFTYHFSPWDPHQLLSRYGYEHRCSIRDDSLDETNSKTALAIHFHLDPRLEVSFFMQAFNLDQQTANRLKDFLTHHQLITSDEELDVTMVSQKSKEFCPIYTEFKLAFPSIQSKVYSFFQRLKTNKLMMAITQSRYLSGFETCRTYFTTNIAHSLCDLTRSQWLLLMESLLLCHNDQLWVGVFENVQMYASMISGQCNKASFNPLFLDLVNTLLQSCDEDERKSITYKVNVIKEFSTQDV